MNYSKTFVWRIIAVFCGLMCVSSLLGVYILTKSYNVDYIKWILIALCSFLLISVIYLIFFPLDFKVYVIWLFVFSCMSAANKSTPLSVILLFNTVFLGYKINLFKKFKWLKIIFMLLVYIGCVVSLIRFTHSIFLEAFINWIAALLAITLLAFIYFYFLEGKTKFNDLLETTEKLELVMQREKLSERDKNILRAAYEGKKYEAIALENNISLSTVKKRISFLYKKLGVTSQVEFLSKYEK